jgi:hypothetical protein
MKIGRALINATIDNKDVNNFAYFTVISVEYGPEAWQKRLKLSKFVFLS